VFLDVQVRDEEDENIIVFGIEPGGLGASWVELYRLLEDECIMVESFS
jgi:hypothetical protein